jgi:PEGA domain-containing protein
MLPIYLMLMLLMAVPSVTRAQESEQQESAQGGAAPAERVAVPRGSRSQGDNPRLGTAVPRTTGFPARSRAQAEQTSAQEPSSEPERRAIPRGSRPQGDNPRIGTAVPRPAPLPRADGGTINRRGPDRGRTVIVRPPIYSYYRPYNYPYSYYYPRQYYPYGYGAFGLGYFYYNPYRWYPGVYSSYSDYGGYYNRSFTAFDIGELRLDVSPRDAQVFVDGYYAGIVDDYDGAFQALKLESGAYRIEISAPGYETLAFDVRITPGQRVRYRGDLRRLP